MQRWVSRNSIWRRPRGSASSRETFKEAVVLLAEGATAQHVDVAQMRAREGLSFGEILARLELRLDWSNVVPWSRWITPRVPALFHKCFDARFFLAAVPNDQQARHDNHEATGSIWLRPRVVLEQYERFGPFDGFEALFA